MVSLLLLLLLWEEGEREREELREGDENEGDEDLQRKKEQLLARQMQPSRQQSFGPGPGEALPISFGHVPGRLVHPWYPHGLTRLMPHLQQLSLLNQQQDRVTTDADSPTSALSFASSATNATSSPQQRRQQQQPPVQRQLQQQQQLQRRQQQQYQEQQQQRHW